MPVEPRIFEFRKICGRDDLPQCKDNHEGDHDRTDQDMQPVDAGHHIIETEEKNLPFTVLHDNRRIRINPFKDLRSPFKVFIDEEENAAEYRYYLKQGG